MVRGFCFLLCILFLVEISVGNNDRFREAFKWKQVDYAFPSEEARNAAIASGEFIKEHILPLGLEVWNGKLFVTVPRWKSGVPSSLNWIPLNSSDPSPPLMPYPNWEIHNITKRSNGTRLVNTFRIRADACDRLWVIDCGLNNILGGGEAVSPTKLLVFDLKTDTLLREYKFKPSHLKEDSFFANVIVDVTPETCGNAYAYMPDLGSYALVVYSWANNDSWRVKHHYFYFDPLQGDLNIGGINFQWTDGIFSVALSPVQEDGYRTAYFHPLCSTREFSVSTKILQNETLANHPSSFHEYKLLGSRGPKSQSTASYLDEKSGILFFTQVNKDAVGCWNSFKYPEDYTVDTNGIVAQDNETMIFPNDLKVDRNSNVWVLTDRLPIYIAKGLSKDDYNYRILTSSVSEAVKGTVCE